MGSRVSRSVEKVRVEENKKRLLDAECATIRKDSKLFSRWFDISKSRFLHGPKLRVTLVDISARFQDQSITSFFASFTSLGGVYKSGHDALVPKK